MALGNLAPAEFALQAFALQARDSHARIEKSAAGF
jgi:hypothetical protein